MQLQLHDTGNEQTKGAVTKTLMNRRILAIVAVVATGAERRLSRDLLMLLQVFPNPRTGIRNESRATPSHISHILRGGEYEHHTQTHLVETSFRDEDREC